MKLKRAIKAFRLKIETYQLKKAFNKSQRMIMREIVLEV